MGRLSLVLALAGAAPAAGQPALDADRYRALIDDTSGGLFITGGRELASYRDASVEAVVDGFLRSGPEPLLIKAAAFLHTEAALNARAARHLDFAEELLRALPEPERGEWLSRWWLAVGYSYHLALNSAAAIAHLEKGITALPGNEDLRLALVRVTQMSGRHREEQPLSRRAAQLLADLHQEFPDNVEYAVRRAAVLFDIGERRAAGQLVAALEEVRMPPYPRLAFLLLKGEMAMDAGDYPAAEAAFAEAVARARRSPGAVSGLVAAQLAQGKNADAAAAAGALLARAPTDWEPEWVFWLGPAIEIPELFGAMRTEIVEGFAR